MDIFNQFKEGRKEEAKNDAIKQRQIDLINSVSDIEKFIEESKTKLAEYQNLSKNAKAEALSGEVLALKPVDYQIVQAVALI
mmetsp:Transcript_248/g.261  ORF Transcript_248/g.261 Transcript_248/m.261 type:complete len:82 (+) Transcript_248:460-705(+)